MATGYISIKVAAKANQCTDQDLFQLKLSTIFAVRSLNRLSNSGGKLVVGSLGIGKRQPFWEWGGPKYTSLDHFLRFEGTLTMLLQDASSNNIRVMTENVVIPCDAYMWVEDDAGRIYDVISCDKIAVAKNLRKSIGIQRPRMLHGLSYSEAQALGFHYLPAPAEVQPLLIDVMMRYSDSLFE